jgi:hypothetical protein
MGCPASCTRGSAQRTVSEAVVRRSLKMIFRAAVSNRLPGQGVADEGTPPPPVAALDDRQGASLVSRHQRGEQLVTACGQRSGGRVRLVDPDPQETEPVRVVRRLWGAWGSVEACSWLLMLR